MERRLILGLIFAIIHAYVGLKVYADLPPITINGSGFFYSTNDSQFISRGVFYGSDGRYGSNTNRPLEAVADRAICERDIPYLKRLGVNLVMMIGSPSRRTECIKKLQEAQIYILILLEFSSPLWVDGAVGRTRANTALKYFEKVIDNYQGHSNTLGFVFTWTPENETTAASESALSQRHFVAEVKDYIKSKEYRKIPIGLLIADLGTTSVAQSMTCDGFVGSSDFLILDAGTNLPSDAAHPQQTPLHAGLSECFSDINSRYRHLSVPLFVRYGYNADVNHAFNELQSIHSNDLLKSFSGAILYHWFGGIVNPKKYNGRLEISGESVILHPASSALSNRLSSITPTSTCTNQFSATSADPPRHHFTFKPSQAKGANLVEPIRRGPTHQILKRMSTQLCYCMMQSLTCISNFNASREAQLKHRDRSCQKPEPDVGCGAIMSWDPQHVAAYDSCGLAEQVAWLLDSQYKANSSNGADPALCTSAGGLTQTPTPTPDLSQECQTLLQQAGPNGTGTVRYISPETLEKDGKSAANSAGSGMSAGVKAGIAVAIVAVIAIVVALILLNLRAWKKKKNAPQAVEIEANEKLEMEGSKVDRPSDDARTLTEIDGIVRYELESPVVGMLGRRVYEARGDLSPREAPGGEDEITEIPKEKDNGAIKTMNTPDRPFK